MVGSWRWLEWRGGLFGALPGEVDVVRRCLSWYYAVSAPGWTGPREMSQGRAGYSISSTCSFTDTLFVPVSPETDRRAPLGMVTEVASLNVYGVPLVRV